MSEMPVPSKALALLTAATNNFSDLLPFLVVMAAGFLVGAWGQASRAPIAVVAGMALIIIAVVGFLGANGTGPIPKVIK